MIIIFLDADTNTILQRIVQRNRPEEMNTNDSFISQIDQKYQNMKSILHEEKTIAIETVSTTGVTIDKVFSKVILIIEKYLNQSYTS